MDTSNEKPRMVTIRTGFEGQYDPAIGASAYLFDRDGSLIATVPLVKNDVKFTVAALPRGARLFIGPTLDIAERAGPPTLSAMDRISAYEPPIRFRPDINIYDIGKVPELIWAHWLLCHCRVTGHVIVRHTSPNGVAVEAPVCNARVHICEVDRLWRIIERLPDPDIFRLRDDLINVIRKPFPWPPEPDPGPWRKITNLPEVLQQRAKSLASLVIGNGVERAALNPQPIPPVNSVALNPQPDPPGDPFLAFPQAAQFALRSSSAAIVRRSLLDHINLIRPWICRWPWLHRWFYRCDELRVVMTDDHGRFETSLLYPCNGDKPDLYFWVDYSIGGVWTPVHRPSVPCHIWWDYPCGTDVAITITDPRVSGCGNVPELRGKQVVVKTIARQVSMGEINRDNDGADLAKAGTVKPGWIHGTRESPFGATLEPRVDFGSGLKPAGITHYRWSYRALGSSSEADWTAISASVLRHYRETPATPLAPTIYKSTQVGPDASIPGGYFFEVDPALPADGEDWEVLDESYDLASAYWDTAGLLGKYELKLELFRRVGGTMTRIDLTAEGVGLNQVTDPAPLTGSTYTATPATDDRTITDPATGHVVGYRLVLHIDNRMCFGTIESVSVSPGANDTKCGFLEYQPGATAMLSFRASHPGNYASFDFNVSRVATPLPSASTSGLVDDAVTTPAGFTRSGDLFSKAATITSLLNEALPVGETPCTRAAFGESLRVYALATNRYGRLSEFDAPNANPVGQIGLRAFAITPA